jgi:hypothetical protein
MLRSTRLQTLVVLATGALLGYLAASDKLNPFPSAHAAPRPADDPGRAASAGPRDDGPACCSDGNGKGTLLALAAPTAGSAATGSQAAGKKPNILVIFGDDIGFWNISAYNRGMMGYRTPNVDRIAREGAIFTDCYAQQSCTAGRAAFITGQSCFRTGLLKVGLPGAKEGLSEKDPTLADLLKPQGYLCGQFGKNHLGDRNEFLPTVHGFDEFFGNLYHLNAEEEPENPTTRRPRRSRRNSARAACCTPSRPTGMIRRKTRVSAGSAGRRSRTPARSPRRACPPSMKSSSTARSSSSTRPTGPTGHSSAGSTRRACIFLPI